MFRLLGVATLRTYALVLFLDQPLAGFAVLVLTFLRPDLGLGGLLAVLAAQLAAIACRYPRELIRSGLYGLSPLLVGLALVFFQGLSPATLLMILPASWLTMHLSTALGSALQRHYGIGGLSLVFAAVTTLCIFPDAVATAPPATTTSTLFELFCRSLGAAFFLPRVDVGVLLFLLVLLHSRALAVLAVIGFTLGTAVFFALGGGATEITWGMAGVNFALTAMAVGGVFLMPGPWATLHALGAVAVSAFLAVVLSRLLTPLGLPLLTWPFNLAALPWLIGLALRTELRAPRPALGFSGMPEAMHTQAALIDRLPAPGPVLRLPVLGEWTVTQAFGGRPTHQPPWEHAWDFELLDAQGFPFRPEQAPATEARAYYSFDAPVVAAADGVVVRTVNEVPDNAPGEINTQDYLGNHVVLQHGERLFSFYAHLRYRSVEVNAGDTVRAGQVLARCGASGRAPRPHLHFHLAASAAADAATLAWPLSEYVRIDREGDRLLVDAGLPLSFERVSALGDLADSVAAPRLRPGLLWRFRVRHGRRETVETWRTDIDLWGNVRVTAESPAAIATWLVDGRGMTATGFAGSPLGALAAFFRGNSRVPPHLLPGLVWHDTVDPAHVAPALANLMRGCLLPLFSFAAQPSRFTATPGEDRDLLPLVTTVTATQVIRTSWNTRHEPMTIMTHNRSGRLALAARLDASLAPNE